MEFTILTASRSDIENELHTILNEHQSEVVSRQGDEKDFAYSVTVDNLIVGGITARLWHTELHIASLALKKEYRGLGIAKQLVEKIEADAVKNGATIITVTTQDFQAPKFYQSLGYRIFATLPDCPFIGTTRYYLEKRI